jgi:hypothetical protein
MRTASLNSCAEGFSSATTVLNRVAELIGAPEAKPVLNGAKSKNGQSLRTLRAEMLMNQRGPAANVIFVRENRLLLATGTAASGSKWVAVLASNLFILRLNGSAIYESG